MYTAFLEESANVIELEGVVEGNADVHCVLGRESATLIRLARAAKVTCSEQVAHHEETERVNHCNRMF